VQADRTLPTINMCMITSLTVLKVASYEL